MSKKIFLHMLLLGVLLFAVGVQPAKSYQAIQLPFKLPYHEDNTEWKIYITDACANGTGGTPQDPHDEHTGNAAYAVDFGVSNGSPVLAPVSGTVVQASWEEGGYGYLVRIKESGSNREHWLGHNSKLIASEGHPVNQGEVVALAGDTGTPKSYHVHYHVQDGPGYGASPIDERGNLPNITWDDPNDYCHEYGSPGYDGYDGYALPPAPTVVEAVITVPAPESPSGPPAPLQENWFTKIWNFIAPYVTYNPIVSFFMPSYVRGAGLEFAYIPVSLAELNAITGVGSSSATPGETIDVIEGADNLGSKMNGLLDIEEQQDDPILQILSITADMPVEYNIRVKVRNNSGDNFQMQRVCIDSWCPESLDADHVYDFSMSTLGTGNHTLEVKYRRTTDNNNWANAEVLYSGSLYVSPIISTYAECGSSGNGALLNSGSNCIKVTSNVSDLGNVNWADRNNLTITANGVDVLAYDSSEFYGAPYYIRNGQTVSVGNNVSGIELRSPLGSSYVPTQPLGTDANTIVYLPMNEGGGTQVASSVGSLTGSLIGSASFTTGRFGTAVHSSTSTQRSGINFGAQSFGTPWTIEMFVKLDNPGDERLATQLGGGPNTGSNKWFIGVTNSHFMVWACWTTGCQQGFSLDTVQANRWYYLMFTYDGATTAKFYVDSILQQTLAMDGVLNGGSTTFEIGKGENIYGCNCTIDDFRISNIVREPTMPSAWNGGLVQNGSFESLTNGWANDWTRNNSNSVVIDTASNGSHGNNSLHFTSDTVNHHAFSLEMPVSFGNSYTWLSRVRSTSGSGEFGFYIDEYDSGHNWISGQWFSALPASVEGTKIIQYTPTSLSVAYASLQYYMNANTSYEVYVDSVTFTQSTSSNLVTNGGFEYLLGGWADAWTRDNTSVVTVSTSSQGNEGTNSLHFAPTSSNAHAFGTRFPVGSGTYTWSQDVVTTSGTGEFGFYIDEYDANGNWISGQWKGGIWGASNGLMSFTYSRSSSSVAFASLQFYMNGGTTFTVYVDSVSFGQ